VRGRNDRDAFQIEGDEGSGTVLAAVAPDPFNFAVFSRSDHWDFRALGGPSLSVRDDPAAKLLDIVQRMSGDSTGRFEYDVATYVVQSYRYTSRYGYDGYGYGYPYRFGFGLSFGYPYRFGYYNPFYDPFCDPFWGCYGGFGYPYSLGYPFGYGFIYRTRIYSRPFVFDNFGNRFATTRTLVMPQNRDRALPVQPRPRSSVGDETPIRHRGIDSRPSFAPRGSSGRPSVSRGWNGGRSRGSHGFSGARSGGSRGGGGRRH